MRAFQRSGPFNIENVSQAPKLPGVYVWYARFAVGEADWHSEYAGGEDKAAEYLMKALKDQSLKFARQEMKIAAAANFSSEWHGTLREDPSARWGITPSDQINPDGFDDRLHECLRNDITRQGLVDLVDHAFPLFSAPLYVGKAAEQTLRDRLRQHRWNYLHLWERSVNDSQFPERLKAPKNFAERAIKLGFTPEDLYCFTLSFDATSVDELTAEDGIALIEATEWILNRWATPILGRQ